MTPQHKNRSAIGFIPIITPNAATGFVVFSYIIYVVLDQILLLIIHVFLNQIY